MCLGAFHEQSQKDKFVLSLTRIAISVIHNIEQKQLCENFQTQIRKKLYGNV